MDMCVKKFENKTTKKFHSLYVYIEQFGIKTTKKFHSLYVYIEQFGIKTDKTHTTHTLFHFI